MNHPETHTFNPERSTQAGVRILNAFDAARSERLPEHAGRNVAIACLCPEGFGLPSRLTSKSLTTHHWINAPGKTMVLLQGVNGSTPMSMGKQDELMNTVSAPPSPHDLDQIWEWNASIPDQVEACVHDLISEIAGDQPDALAVCAWDGNLTYTQLDILANNVARRLIDLGSTPKTCIPILFTKSRWTCVAMLAVMKAGCSVVALDAAHPDTRLRSIIQQTRPNILVSSSALRTRASSIADLPVLDLADTLLETIEWPETTLPELPPVSPSDIVYISFTSGTTGQPKGACISHANVRSAIRHQSEKLGFNRGSRVLDFAPYSFDVAWSNFLHTLCTGGRLCIDTEQSMLNDLSSSINKFNATLINITPTVLRTISPVPSSLESVLLSGEMPYRENWTQWAGHVRLLNTYGPTECTFKSTFSALSPSQEDRPDIGKGVGFATWIVDEHDGDRLRPIGAVGELYLEGPQVGQGYLSDPASTASAFISDPPWLLAGGNSACGRQGRLYKTGDLVKYKPDGRLLFVGRKDASQVKIRGQRVETGDVEHHVRHCLDVALPAFVEAVLPRGSDTLSLILFIVTKNVDGEQLNASMGGLEDQLRQVLPDFMIPSAYLPLDQIPVASTGKVDRRRLRLIGGSLTWAEIITAQSTILPWKQHHEPVGNVENQLCDIWAEVLGLDPKSLSRTGSFLHLGGDSIAAMRVVSTARDRNLHLTVADLFRFPVLADLAKTTRVHATSQETELLVPFSLLEGTNDLGGVCEEAARLCGVHTNDIEDIYPCTPLQQGLLAMTTKSAEKSSNENGSQTHSAAYISRTAYVLPRDLEVKRFEMAWGKTVQQAPILRTRIIELPGHGLVQVALKFSVPMRHYTLIGEFMQNAQPMGLGTSLCRAGLACQKREFYFLLEMHHAIFDGWSSRLTLDALDAAYHEQQHSSMRPLQSIQPFIKHLLAADHSKSASFWREYLLGSEATVFPSPSDPPRAKLDLDHTISGLHWPHKDTTPSTAVNSALALLLASYTNANDVKYGTTVSGRQASVPGIDRIAGPTVATIPVRVILDWDQTVESFQHQVQQRAVATTEHEQFGLQNIQHIDESVGEASQFQLLVVVQPIQKHEHRSIERLTSRAKSILPATEVEAGHVLVSKDGQADSIAIYNSYAMMMICQLEESGLTLKINFDSGAMDRKEVHRMALQFEHLLRQLCSEELANTTLRHVTAISMEDLDQVWEWNEMCPRPVEESVIDMIDRTTELDPASLAISAWDKRLTYQQMRVLSHHLALRLRDAGVVSGSIVVLSFEKSSWLIVSMLSVLKVGAVALPISPPTSRQRAQEIAASLQPKLVLTSDQSTPSPFAGLVKTSHVSELHAPAIEGFQPDFQSHDNQPSDPAIILFTSGSTGAPKSILWSHGTLSSNIRAASASFGITAHSRVFQFAGYEFDVSTVEALSTLSVGGCLCIPSDSDRTDRLAEAIRDAHANWLCLTPSVADTLVPEALPSLETLVFAGEELRPEAAFRWTDTLDSVFNWYGPAEASVATSCLVNRDTWKTGVIGTSTIGATWLTDPQNPNHLAPIGAIAELCIEGSTVARYTGSNGESLNETAFITPPWLLAGHKKAPGRSGQIYRTGDLVKYGTNGSLVFVRRKQESQRKLRGHRLDLAHIEQRVQSFLSGKVAVNVVAEIFTPSDSNAETLAVFISPKNAAIPDQDVDSFVQRNLMVDELEAYLLEQFPSYMIPNTFIPISKTPVNHSGKTDRRRIRQIGSSLTQEQIVAMQPARREARVPSTDMEKLLQRLWANVISINPDSISANDNFLRLGGESVTAMRLVALIREQGLLLTVADVFQAPQLESMAKLLVRDDEPSGEDIAPFSLLGGRVSEAESRATAARLCSVPESRIVDMFPCTALQQGLLALGAKRRGQYVSRSVLALQPGISADQLANAWRVTVHRLPILRTRIVDTPEHGLAQVVLDKTELRSGFDVDAYIREDEQEIMGLGTELCRAAVIERNFILTIHHCMYDGNVLKMMLDELKSQYLNKKGLTITPFQNFISHLNKVDQQEAADFWKGQLQDREDRQFPPLPHPAYEPTANEQLDYPVTTDWPRTGVTPSTILRSAWAILAAQYTSSLDVLFGVTVSGRQANMRGMEACAGPTISTVPVAISIDWEESIGTFLGRCQHQMVGMTPFEQYGLQNMRRIHPQLKSDLIQTLLVVQPVAEGKSLNEGNAIFQSRSFSSNLGTHGTDPFNTYALMLVCELTAHGLHLRISFDGNVIAGKQINRIARQYETIIHQLCANASDETKLDALQTASSNDLEIFWTQNAKLPEDPQTCLPALIAMAFNKRPKAVAIDAWDGKFSYQQVEELSSLICQNLTSLGVERGSVVALCFEKSKWTPIAQLAVMKAGAVMLLQSVAIPAERMGTVFKKAGVLLAVASDSRVDMARLHARGYTIDQLMTDPLTKSPIDVPISSMGDPAAILVSSGSTGEPKQILWSHRTLAANVAVHARCVSMNPATRVLQFASYDFDASTVEIMSALANSACVCIPSESERVDGLANAISRFAANYINITPSTAKLLYPEEIPCLSTLVLSGENLVEDDVNRWRGKCRVINWYGPAEASSATFCDASVDSWHSGVIGQVEDSKSPMLRWLVDPRNHNRLMPFGAVGEIALEGPICSDGYIGNSTLINRLFRENPDFLSSKQGPGRPKSPRRIYLTGDLARYNTNGDLIFLGRKDSQLKLRGQLVAPAEVEHHIRTLLEDSSRVQVVVDATKPRNGGTLTLVAFLAHATEAETERATTDFKEKLNKVLPAYAIPSYYIPISAIPTTPTGKRDRNRLLEIGAAFDPPQQGPGRERREPSTTAEKTLRELWSRALGVDQDTISASDSFLRVGDSIQAMRLVGIARQQGLLLTVAEIFQHPVLQDMAKLLKDLEDVEDNIVEPFSLLQAGYNIESVRQHAASLCGVPEDDIEDVFPCTPLQGGLLALSMKRQGDYTGRNLFQLAPSADPDLFRAAWERVVSSLAVLRTRIINLPEQGLVQVIVKAHDCWTETTGIDSYLKAEQQLSMGLGTPLMRCGLFDATTVGSAARTNEHHSRSILFALTTHHSIYDGSTMDLVMETLNDFYTGATHLRHQPFQSFVKYISSQDKGKAAEYWTSQLAGSEAPQFPALPSPTYEPLAESSLAHSVENMTWREDDVTPTTVLRAAFALLLSQHSNSSDIVFGTVVSGRKAPVSGIERVAGPAIATVPVRVQVDYDGSTSKLLTSLQTQETEMILYEQTGLSAIRQFSEAAQQVCQFQALLVVQPEEQKMADNVLFAAEVSQDGRKGEAHRYHGFTSYGLSMICTLRESGLKLEFCFDSTMIQHETVQRMAQQFELLLRELCAQRHQEIRLGDIEMITDQDHEQIWKWNAEVPESIERCMHSIFTEVAQAQPDAVAISAWDGDLSYGVLDRLSDAIAHHLVELGVTRNTIVPLCYGKSMYSVVALLSVMKAGGASVLLDPALPYARVEVMMEQVEPHVVICSASNEALCSKIGAKTVILDADSDLFRTCTAEADTAMHKELPHVDPSDLLYAVFTSGSTGIPKGCLMQHRNFSSAVVHQRSTLGLDSSSRMYDFSSYTFDAVHWSIYHIFAAGGTLCIPSEVERKRDLTYSMRRFLTTDLFLTPSVARLVDVSMVPTLRNVHLGGEAVTEDDFARWVPFANAFNMYGPAECCAATLYYNIPNSLPPRVCLGRGSGIATWIVDPKSGQHLSPVGAIGELYLEGPLIGKGYLADEQKTASSFIRDPPWLRKGTPRLGIRGRTGRLYKTGDLVKYNPADGTLIFVGRRDTQVKLRGQRIELAEVEYHVRQLLTGKLKTPTSIAEVVINNTTGNHMLVAFVQVAPDEEGGFGDLTRDLENELREKVPPYMVPGAFIPIEHLPLAASGKTNRRRLRVIGANLDLRQVAASTDHVNGKAPPLSDTELQLQKLWIEVLGVPADQIYSDTSFLRLGGDSISAMKLAGLARSRGLYLTVQCILTTPQLSKMSESIVSLSLDLEVPGNAIESFSLLQNPDNKDATVTFVAKQCDVDISQIEDVFPSTGLQKSLLAMTAKSDRSYIARFTLQLGNDIDLDRFMESWEKVSQTSAPILRYRIVDVPTEGLVQVQLSETLTWQTYSSAEAYLEMEQGTMGLGTPLTRLAIVGNSGRYYCVLTQHHAIYDGYSVELLLTEVAKAYAGKVDDSSVAPFQAFIKHIADTDTEKTKEFWRGQFADLEAVPFPALPAPEYRPKADSTTRRRISDFKWSSRDATASTMIRAAWAILTAHYTDAQDVVFGAMVTGRQAPLAGLDRMIAPLINAVPVRVLVDPKKAVAQLLDDVQKQSIAMIPYEQTELHDIQRLGEDAAQGSRFNTLLVVQPARDGDYMDSLDSPFRGRPESMSISNNLDDFNPNAVMILCQLTKNDELDLEIGFDSNVMDVSQMERMAAQFEHVLHQICGSTTEMVEDIETVSPEDIRELWGWNALIPEATSECVHDLIAKTIKRQPQDPAICAWDGQLTYAELDNLSRHLALHLVSLGVQPGAIIPLCFEKSMWYPVAALGAMRAGAICVGMDSTQPEARLKSIVEQVDPRFVLVSLDHEELASRLYDVKVIVVDRDRIESYTVNSPAPSLPSVGASSGLYVVFTSGSTGTPKGILTTHENFASAATHQAEILHITQGTRVFDFVSYNFDVSWSNHLQTLICGGCLCIPSEWERRNDIPNALNRMDCDYVYFTPSVAQSLEPSSMPGIRTLAMGGEPIRSAEVSRWKQAETMIGIYGPAECAQALSFTVLSPKTPNGHVGHSFGANTWLVQPDRPHKLAAIGAIGELMLEGPTVSKGYFADPEKTKEAYVQDPPWLLRGSSGQPGRHGMLYKSGDLLRYTSDGALEFIGRKDGMIKLRGQRIELAEIEHHVRSSLHDPTLCSGVAAEMIMPRNRTRPILAVFLSLSAQSAANADEAVQSRLMRAMHGLEDRLSDRLPQYMVPGAYLYVEKIPMTTTNKTDRRALRELGNAQSLETLAELHSRGTERRPPSTPMERQLQSLWSSILEIEPSSISAESSFLRIGGESIAAMRLVSAARAQGLSLAVADIFKAPRLCDLALRVRDCASEEMLPSQPRFSLLRDDAALFVQKFVEPALDVDKMPNTDAVITDVLPATDFQVQSVLDSLQDPPGRLPYWIFHLPTDVDFAALEEACHKLVRHFDILHTVFVKAGGGFWQVLLSNFVAGYETLDYEDEDEDVTAFIDGVCEKDVKRRRQLGRSLIRFYAIRHPSGKHKLVFRISHAQFDGYSWGTLLQTLSSMYLQERLPPTPPFRQYMAFLEDRKEESLRYWAGVLQGFRVPYSHGRQATHQTLVEDRLVVKKTLRLPRAKTHEGISPATMFHAACALVLSRAFNREEIVFGRLVTGRAMLPSELQDVVGPTMTEVPIRITVAADATVVDVAKKLQKQFIQDATHEAAGMEEIIRNCTDWPEQVTDFGWRTAYQQEEEEKEEFTFLGSPSSVAFYDGPLPPRRRPEVYATPRNGHLDLEFEGNRRLTAEGTVRELLDQLAEILENSWKIS